MRKKSIEIQMSRMRIGAEPRKCRFRRLEIRRGTRRMSADWDAELLWSL